MQSKSYREVKREIGQLNHFFITLLVGLNAVKDGAEKSSEMHESWNPRDKEKSVRRSHDFAKKATLAWTVDNLDSYFSSINKAPYLIDDEVKKRFDDTRNGRSVYNRFLIVCDYYNQLDEFEVSFVDLLICWRNNMVHKNANNKLQTKSEEYLLKLDESNPIINKYHLDVSSMLKRFNSFNEPPSNKELETMISMTIHFIEHLDELLMDKIDKCKYARELIKSSLKDGDYKYNYLSETNQEKRVIEFKNILKSKYCFTDDFFDDELEKEVNIIAKMRLKELKAYLQV